MFFKNYLIVSICLLAFIFFLAVPAKDIEAATLTLSPASGSYNIGDTITVSINLNTQGVGVAGVDINDLNYNTTLFSVIDEDLGQVGTQISVGTLLPTTVLNRVDTATGAIQFSQVSVGGATSQFNGSGTLATVRFTVLSSGTGNITFDFTPGSSGDTNVASGGVDVLSSVTNASFTINPPASNKFSIGDFVITTTNDLNVRTTANGTSVGTQSLSALGTVIGGPINSGGFDWWEIDYVNSPDGWSADGFLETTTNSSPSVNAGINQTVTIPASVSLFGSVSDDGLPNVGGSLVTVWSKSSGPGTVTFGNISSLNTTASFSSPGSYSLQLSANDGLSQTSDLIGITVNISSITNFYFEPTLEGRSNVSGSSFTISVYSQSFGSNFKTFTSTADMGQKVLLSSNTLSDNTYGVEVNSPSYLNKRYSNVSMASNGSAILAALPAGDINNDNAINSLDWSDMNPVWFTSNQQADINQDGKVNSIDFSYLVLNWGTVGD